MDLNDRLLKQLYPQQLLFSNFQKIRFYIFLWTLFNNVLSKNKCILLIPQQMLSYQQYIMQKSGQNNLIHLSKSMSYLLRHHPPVALDSAGFMPISDLLNHKSISKYTLSDIECVVNTNDKKRFQIKEIDNIMCIRAVQGHTLKDVTEAVKQIGIEEITTEIIHVIQNNEIQYQGTYLKSWESIKQKGLSRMARNHIHLSQGFNAISGMRKTCDIFIQIDVLKAMQDGIIFFKSENGVILTEGKNGFLDSKFFKQVTNSDGKNIFP